MHLAVLVHAVDREIVAADHEVGVVSGVVDADLVQLLLGHALKALDALVEAEAEREMARGVLIEERVVEEQTGLVDRGLLRHERDLAEIVTALVHADDLLENVLPLFGLDLHGAALFKPDGEVLDELALVGERLCCVHDTLGGAAVGRGKDLLGRHIGIVNDALHGRVASGVELSRRDEADFEVRAVRGAVMQLPEMETVQILAARLEIAVVRFPVGDGVLAVGAGGIENILPELLHGGALAELGVDLLRPRFARHGGNAPLVLVVYGVPVGLGNLDTLGKRLEIFRVDAAQSVGILGLDENTHRQTIYHVLHPRLFPLARLGQIAQLHVARGELGELGVIPVNGDAARAGLIALLREHLDELRLVESGEKAHLLTLLYVGADAHDELRILAQNGFFHGH